MRNARVLFAGLMILVLFRGRAGGQGSATGTVAGTVTDQKGAAVPGATIELLNTATNESRTQTTNDAGYYTFVSVPPGTYKVVFKKDGFRTTTMGPLDAQVGKSLTANVQLEIGTMAQTVEVIAGAGVELQTMDSSVGNVLDRKVLDTMPTLARDATAILLLQPLATPGFNSVGTPTQGGEGDNTGGQIARARGRQNSFLLHGGDLPASPARRREQNSRPFPASPPG